MSDEERRESSPIGEDQKKSRKRLGSPQPVPIPGAQEQLTAPFLPPWVAGGSPAKFVTHDELVKMTSEMENMDLIHEIAIDQNFKIPDQPAHPLQLCVRYANRRDSVNVCSQRDHAPRLLQSVAPWSGKRSSWARVLFQFSYGA